MRAVLIALMVALLATPAMAQRTPQVDPPGQQRMRHSGHKPLPPQQSARKAREEERAAKSAIEQLPDKPYDPWRNVR